MVTTITIKMNFWLTNLLKQDICTSTRIWYEIAKDLQRFTESNSKGPKTIDLTGGMVLLGHSLPSRKQFGVKPIFPTNSSLQITTAIYNITVNKFYLNYRGRRVFNFDGISKPTDIRGWCSETFVCRGSHFNSIPFGNPTKGIVADNHEIFCVFVHINLS